MKCMSFFSYKGGSGRTTLLYNVLPILAKKLNATPQEPIIVVDFDVDSKGLSYLFNNGNDYDNTKINAIQVLKGNCQLGLDMRCDSLTSHPFFRDLQGIGAKVGLDFVQDRSILFLSAISEQKINGKDNQDTAQTLLHDIMELCDNYNCKAFIIDTPAGDQMPATVAFLETNIYVTVMRITKQFRQGTKEFLQRTSNGISDQTYIFVPNAVPVVNNDSPYKIDKYMNEIKKIAENNVGNNIANLKLLENGNTGINEVLRFKFEETCLEDLRQTVELSADEQKAYEMYNLLAEEIVNINE